MIENTRMSQARKNAHIIGLTLLFITFSPSLPDTLGRSLLPSVFTLTIYSLLIIYLLMGRKLVLNIKLILFWTLQYIFLLGTIIPSDEKIIPADFTELIIPLGSIFITVYLYSIFYKMKDEEVIILNKTLYKYIYFIVLVILFIAILEFTETEVNLLYFLYKPYEKYLGSTRVVTFFLYPYYLTFFLLTVLCLTLPALSYKRSLSSFIIFFCILTIILIAQSQSGLVSSFLLISLYFFIRCPNYINILFRSLLLLIGIAIASYYLPKTIKWLALNTDLYTFKAMNRIITAPETSGTLNIRVEQILNAIEASYDNYLLVGAGWGRDVYLESWLSYLVHKYGLFYSLLLSAGWVLLIYKLFASYRLFYYKNKVISYYLKSFLIFVIVLPISLSSAFTLFTHKLTLLFYFIIMLSLHFIRKAPDKMTI